MKRKPFNFCVFFIILALKQHQTRNVSWACIFTSWPGFVCLYVCVCLCLTETDRATDREGWMSVGVGASINTQSMEAHGLSDPNVNFRGGRRGHRRGQRSAFMLMTNNAQLCPEHREKTVTTGELTLDSMHFTNHPVILWAVLYFTLINELIYS